MLWMALPGCAMTVIFLLLYIGVKIGDPPEKIIPYAPNIQYATYLGNPTGTLGHTDVMVSDPSGTAIEFKISCDTGTLTYQQMNRRRFQIPMGEKIKYSLPLESHVDHIYITLLDQNGGITESHKIQAAKQKEFTYYLREVELVP